METLDAAGSAAQRLAGVFTAPAGNETACEAAWESVLVVEPGLQPETPSLFDADLDAGHPLLAQVRGRQADPGVHEVSSQPGATHLAYLLPELIRRELVVPGPEGRWTVLHAVARVGDFAELFLRIDHQPSRSDRSQRSRNRFGPIVEHLMAAPLGDADLGALGDAELGVDLPHPVELSNVASRQSITES